MVGHAFDGSASKADMFEAVVALEMMQANILRDQQASRGDYNLNVRAYHAIGRVIVDLRRCCE